MASNLLKPKNSSSTTTSTVAPPPDVELDVDTAPTDVAEILKIRPNILASTPAYGTIEWAMKVKVMAARQGSTPQEETRYNEEFWKVMWNL